MNVNIDIDKSGKDCGCPPNGNVVPAPPAWLLGVLGLPVFMFVARRRKKAAELAGDNLIA